MSNERTALICAVGTIALWSTVATGFKLGLEVLEPIQLLFLGSATALVIFCIAAIRTGWPRDGFYAGEGLLLGVLNPFLYYVVLFEAYDRLPAHIAQPLNQTWAVTLAILSVPILGQKLSLRTIIGILVSYGGVLILLSQGRITVATEFDGLGIFLALFSTILWAVYWLFNARSKTSAEALMATSFLIATPIIGLVCWAEPGLPPITPQTMFYGAWVGVAEMGIAFLLWQRALRLTQNVARMGQLIFLVPFVSLIMIGAVVGEKVGASAWIGLVVIVAGVLLARRETTN